MELIDLTIFEFSHKHHLQHKCTDKFIVYYNMDNKTIQPALHGIMTPGIYLQTVNEF